MRASQWRMLRMNQFLMGVSTAVAVRVLGGVCLPAAALSLALNVMHGGHECANTAVAAAAAMMWCGGGDGGGGSPIGGLAVFVALSAVPLSWVDEWTRDVARRRRSTKEQ